VARSESSPRFQRLLDAGRFIRLICCRPSHRIAGSASGPPTLTVYDRLIPCQLYESEGFVDLPTDTHRLLFLALFARADDFGNQEADRRELLRWAVYFTQIKTADALAAALSALEGAGLVRVYEADSKPYLNLPGFKNRRTYVRRTCPPSPWCDKTAPVGAFKAGHRRRGPSVLSVAGPVRKMSDTIVPAPKPESDLTQEVGEEKGGVRGPINPSRPTGLTLPDGRARPINGAAAAKPDSELAQGEARRGEYVRGNPPLPTPSRLPKDWVLPDAWAGWAVGFWANQRQPLSVAQVRALADQFRDYWHAKSGKDSCQLDWFASWRIWVYNHGVRELGGSVAR
jgi:hypothetical protein